MAIGFARCVFVQRSRGHSILAAAAYIGRTKLAAPYPAVDYSDRHDLLFPISTLVPPDAPLPLHDCFTLWHAVELASRRKDATLGQHLMLALPAPAELPASRCLPLVEEFIEALILPHGLAASFAIHEPHDVQEEGPMRWLEHINTPPKAPTETNLSNRNRHAHVLISPRRVGRDGIDPRRYTALDPAQVSFNRDIRGVAVAGVDWPELWARHQNSFFARWGLGLRVRPRAGYADYHHGSQHRAGSKAGRDAKQSAASTKNVVERANRATVSDPAQLLALVGRRPFTEQDLRGMVERYVGVGHPYAETTADAAMALPGVIRLKDRLGVSGTPWLATHDLARMEQKCIVLAASLMDKEGSLRAQDLGLSQGLALETLGSMSFVNAVMDEQPPNSACTPLPGIKLVVIDSGRGAVKLVARALTPYTIREKLRPGSVVLVDYADNLSAEQLQLVLLAVLVTPECHLVLMRRPPNYLDPQNSLLDIIVETMGATTRPTNGNRSARAVSSLEIAISRLEARNDIIFADREELVSEVALHLDRRRRTRPDATVFCPDYEFSAWLRMNRLPVSRIGGPEIAVLVHTEASFGNLTILPLLTSIEDVTLLVDQRYCPDMPALYEQAHLSLSVPCAVALPPQPENALQRRDTPSAGAAVSSIRWTVDHAGKVGTTSEHIATSLAHSYEALLDEEQDVHIPWRGSRLTALLGPELDDEVDADFEQPLFFMDAPEEELSHSGVDEDDDPSPDDYTGSAYESDEDNDDEAEPQPEDGPDPVEGYGYDADDESD